MRRHNRPESSTCTFEEDLQIRKVIVSQKNGIPLPVWKRLYGRPATPWLRGARLTRASRHEIARKPPVCVIEHLDVSYDSITECELPVGHAFSWPDGWHVTLPASRRFYANSWAPSLPCWSSI